MECARQRSQVPLLLPRDRRASGSVHVPVHVRVCACAGVCHSVQLSWLLSVCALGVRVWSHLLDTHGVVSDPVETLLSVDGRHRLGHRCSSSEVVVFGDARQQAFPRELLARAVVRQEKLLLVRNVGPVAVRERYEVLLEHEL